MAKIHRSDAPLPQTPSVQVKASYTVTDLPKVSPQEPAAFYDQDNDEDYRRRETAKCKKKRGNLLYTLAMIVFAAIFLISGGLLVKRFLDDRKTESEFADLQSMIDTAATRPRGGECQPQRCQVCCPARQEQRLYRLDLHRRHQSGFSGYVRAGQQRTSICVMTSTKPTASTAYRTWTSKRRSGPTPRATT